MKTLTSTVLTVVEDLSQHIGADPTRVRMPGGCCGAPGCRRTGGASPVALASPSTCRLGTPTSRALSRGWLSKRTNSVVASAPSGSPVRHDDRCSQLVCESVEDLSKADADHGFSNREDPVVACEIATLHGGICHGQEVLVVP